MLNALFLILASATPAAAPEAALAAGIRLSAPVPQEPARPTSHQPASYSEPSGGTPEPATMLLLAGAAAGYALHRLPRRRNGSAAPTQPDA